MEMCANPGSCRGEGGPLGIGGSAGSEMWFLNGSRPYLNTKMEK